MFTYQRYVSLEIIPPSNTKQTTFTTEQFLTALHGLGQQASLLERYILRRKKLFSLELVSEKESGIRYILNIPVDTQVSVRRNIVSFLPGAEVSQMTEDYLPNKNSSSWIVKELQLTRPFPYPLQEQKMLSQYDPIAYFTGHMTQLDPNETILMQLVVTPVTASTHPSEWTLMQKLKRALANGQDSTSVINSSQSFLPMLIENIFLCIAFIPLSVITLIGSMFSQNKQGDFLPFWIFRRNLTKATQPLSNEQQENQNLTGNKIKKELFETSIRIYVTQSEKKKSQERMQGLIASFQTLHTSLQGIRVKHNWFNSFTFFKLKHRLLSLSNNPIISVSELANIYHFPYSPITHTEDLLQNKNQELPAPLSLKNDTKNLDGIFANNTYGQRITPIGLTLDQRRKHLYVIGGTGMGKTTLLQTMILKDIENGKGVCVIDFHGDLVESLLHAIAEKRHDDVALLNPDDSKHPFSINILELPTNLSQEDLRKYKDKMASSVISLFVKLFPVKASTHRMEHLIRVVVLTALETEKPTLFTLEKLLTDYAYRKDVVAKLTDPVLISYWTKQFAKMGSYQRNELITPIVNRIGKFATSYTARNILMQHTSTIDFQKIIDEKKILLCNFAKGKLEEDTSAFFGALVTAKIQLAALKRAYIPEEERQDFYLYIDEFQNLATDSFGEIMSEARKYRLNTILAHQNTAQIKDKDLIEIILANCGTLIAFRTGSARDQEYILPFLTPEVAENQLNTLDKYHFYIRIVGTKPQAAFTGQTQKTEIQKDQTNYDKIVALSRKKYTKPQEEVEKELQELFGNTEKPQTKSNTKSELNKAKAHHLQKEKHEK